MANYHMSPDGVARKCTAQPGNCKIGGGQHFPSEEAAYKNEYKTNVTSLRKEASSSYTSTPIINNRKEKLMKALKIGGGVGLAATAALSMGVMASHSTAAGQEIQERTPYSVSMQTVDVAAHTTNISGTVMGTNLQKSNFNSCTGNLQSSTPTITCKTVDGKFTVTADYNHTAGRTTQTQNTKMNGLPVVAYNRTLKQGHTAKSHSQYHLSNVKVQDNANGSSHSLPIQSFDYHNNTLFLPKTAN